MTLDQYISNLNQRYKLGNATEHTFRGDLQQLIESLVPEIRATNEPKRQACGAPDYILTKKDIPVGFIEAKDINDSDLDGVKKTGNKEQFDRYKESLDNLIFTDYLDFHFYHDGVFVISIRIAEVRNGAIVALPENFAQFTNLLIDFCSHIGQTIKSSLKLAQMMAAKARLLSVIIEKALTSDEHNVENSTLEDQMIAFKEILIHDISPKGFADVYAQTIAYGLFAARLHDPTLPTFSRQEAAELIPKSNPFLRKLFGYIAGPDLDDRIKWIVDNLVEIFLACNVEEILKNYGKSTKMEDPIIHFYETFLSEYDPKLRKARGVWYTPAPVVNFIVRAVDEILKTEFDMPQGLADTSKTKIKVDVQGKKVEQEVHKVQILDPATGTGTFLAEAVKLIHKKFEGQQGIWSNYVETHLLPRLNGFELLMASYAMAHLKLDLLLKETGYKPTRDQRLRVYLTNSLEEHHQDTGTLFANWLSTEANEANRVKRDTPVMCIIGNPPYSGESANKGEWIMSLMDDYKKEPGGKEKLKERNPKAINDDYVKFLRYGQHFIEKNGSGVLAFINPHGFLDNLTYRGMRWNLLKTYDKIHTIDLHGNSKKKETAPDGSADVNVFDIMQGVSINIFVKTGKKKPNELGKVFHYDLFGKRENKYDFLIKNSIQTIPYKELMVDAPDYFFVNKEFSDGNSYTKGFAVTDLLPFKSSGIKTHDDKNLVTDNIVNLELNINRLNHNFDKSKVYRYFYRPFDCGYIYYDPKILGRAREKSIYHLKHKNIGLILVAQPQSANLSFFDCIYLTNCLADTNMYRRGGPLCFPLYLYPETTAQQSIDGTIERRPNLNMEIVEKMVGGLGLRFVMEKSVLTSPTPRKEGLSLNSKDAGNKLANQMKGLSSCSEKTFTDSPSSKAETCKGKQGTILGYGYVTANANTYNVIKERRDDLKHNPTEAEIVIWEYLRNKKTGFKIRRQHIIDSYIPDFVCLSKNVIIEIDGKIHLQQIEEDNTRTSRLNELGYDVLRFTNEEVMENPELVASKIKSYLEKKEEPLTNKPTMGAGSPPLEGLGEVAPIDILDYIYAVLHSPTYREKYKEFLKIDFPRVPYPKDADTFWQLVELGREIREIHLLESPTVEKYITQYPIDGDNVVIKPNFQNGKVYLNETQYFDNVPEVAWNFYIGGYQPAQKWLKDRKERKLEFEDILHYQKIIVALTETDRLMKAIDGIEIE